MSRLRPEEYRRLALAARRAERHAKRRKVLAAIERKLVPGSEPRRDAVERGRARGGSDESADTRR